MIILDTVRRTCYTWSILLMGSLSPYRMPNSIVNSYVKELKNTDTKKINSDILEDTGLNIISKKIKKEISSITGSGITLRNNEIKDIMKVKS